MALNDELFVAIAQIAVALIGFSGVVVSLDHAKNEWTQSDLLQLRTLVELRGDLSLVIDHESRNAK
ncbi:MAG: hypothetical protein ACI831_000083 [Candidatus Azotimanducaceae bacterium]